MELHLMHFLIVCPLVFLAGFVDAVAGGGGLISLPAYMIAGLPVHFAIGTNKLSSGMGTTLATARFAKNGYIAWKNALLCIVTALIGSSLGAKLALQLDDYYFKRLILVILPCTALYLTFGKPFVGEKESFPVRKMILFSALIAFIIGIYDGFYGPGTGTFLLLLLTGIAHMGLKEANGITKAINLTTNLTALAVYLMNGKSNFPSWPYCRYLQHRRKLSRNTLFRQGRRKVCKTLDDGGSGDLLRKNTERDSRCLIHICKI